MKEKRTMHLISSKGGCCGNNRLYSRQFETPVIGDNVETYENCQDQGLDMKYIITSFTDTEITCTITEIDYNPSQYYIEHYIPEMRNTAFIPHQYR